MGKNCYEKEKLPLLSNSDKSNIVLFSDIAAKRKKISLIKILQILLNIGFTKTSGASIILRKHIFYLFKKGLIATFWFWSKMVIFAHRFKKFLLLLIQGFWCPNIHMNQ